MKKITLLFLLFPLFLIGQEFQITDKTVTAIFQHDSIKKTDLFYKINKWIAKNYNSAQDVIQMSNEESGNIILKGNSKILYTNQFKILYPNNKLSTNLVELKFNHQLEINVKDNKYRVIFSVGDVISDPNDIYKSSDLINDLIKLTGSDEDKILNYNEFQDKLLRSAFIGKKKRNLYKTQTAPIFNEINGSLIEYAKLLMFSINDNINKSTKDDW